MVENILAKVKSVPAPAKSISIKHVKPPNRAGILPKTL
jgi:hypothetical protein